MNAPSNPSGMDRIRELTNTLDMPHGVIAAPGVKQFVTNSGTVLTWTIHWQEEFAITHIFLSESTKLKHHIRNEKEWIIVVSGELIVTIGDKDTIILPHDYLVLQPNVAHAISSKQDTYVISVTMPASADWSKK